MVLETFPHNSNNFLFLLPCHPSSYLLYQPHTELQTLKLTAGFDSPPLTIRTWGCQDGEGPEDYGLQAGTLSPFAGKLHPHSARPDTWTYLATQSAGFKLQKKSSRFNSSQVSLHAFCACFVFLDCPMYATSSYMMLWCQLSLTSMNVPSIGCSRIPCSTDSMG